MKVVFSRKGVDSAVGECASALIGERPVSLPIPTRMPSPTCYADLAPEMAGLSNDLSAGKLAPGRPCHLDPDIDPGALPTRPPDWRGALGQVAAAQSHLRNRAVGPGDLFLFWGLYRPVAQHVGAWRYVGPRSHALFGWLHVQDVALVTGNGDDVLRQYPWLAAHPHVRPGWDISNAVYVASPQFTLAGRKFPGSGLFRRAFRLTAAAERLPSVWRVPSWLDLAQGGVGLSYHPSGRWLGGGKLRAASRGQEFVADIDSRADAEEWIADLLETHR